MAPESQQLIDCEQSLLSELKAPSTYKRIEANQVTIRNHEPPYHSVRISYDAANAYGTPIRDDRICAYKLGTTGQPTLERIDLSELYKVDADTLEAATLESSPPPEPTPAPMPNEDPESASLADAPEKAVPQYPGNCYKDYCPCEPPQGGPDQLLCDQLEEGIEVDVQLMIAGRGMREARRQLQETDF